MNSVSIFFATTIFSNKAFKKELESTLGCLVLIAKSTTASMFFQIVSLCCAAIIYKKKVLFFKYYIGTTEI